ncbi:MAG TPA: CopG family transcriptional regulator [Thermoanaerobaculia bacterium]|nr:CopG family transcriptional regulator [Thermoanaerobaculia bacterium]
MATKTRGLRIPEELDRAISRESQVRGKSWGSMTAELLEESLRMRRAPGVVFLDGPAGRRAAIAASGLDVWEVIATWKAEGGSFPVLRNSYPWLTEPQLRAAVSYYELYPTEIDARLANEAEWTPERVARELPFARPRAV